MEDVISQIEQEMRDLKAQLDSHPYAATTEDYIVVDGEQLYKDEFFQNMPADYAMLLGRFGALGEASDIIAKDIIQQDLKSHLDSVKGIGEHGKRWEIDFNE